MAGMRQVKHDQQTSAYKTKEEILQEYARRMTYVRNAQLAYGQKDFINAIENYNNYLGIVGKVNNSQPYALTPQMFSINGSNNKTELMMVSHIYWNLAKIYDSSSIMGDNFQKALRQFVVFTINQSHQGVNTKIIRKYMQGRKSRNSRAFEAAYREIISHSKKCYVATCCYGEDHPITEELRIVRNRMLEYKLGELFVWNYYRISPSLVEFCQNSKLLGKLVQKIVFKPAVYLFYRLVR